MMNEPILAAIIFTYNHAHMIEKCIESHVNQKTTYPYEIRIYDDCSTDGTTEICRKLADKYPEKIKFFPQTKNTFLMPYEQMQSYQAIQQIDTKYFCIIDGDDCWCDENKVQMALDFLENNPNYVGFAHDTMHINIFKNKEESWVNKLNKWNVENPIKLGATPFFFTSSRVFKNIGFAEKKLLPIDYLLYFYHFSKGPIYYHDEIMANYYISKYNTFSNLPSRKQNFLLSTFAYKIAKLFDFKEDELAMDVQKYYNKVSGLKSHYISLILLKKIFGIKMGWTIWYFILFVPVYGLESMELNWVCPRKKVIINVKNRDKEDLKRRLGIKKKFENNLKKKEKHISTYKKILLAKKILPSRFVYVLEKSIERKLEKIDDYKETLLITEQQISELNIIIAETALKNKQKKMIK